MEFFAAVAARRSVRKFTAEAVPEAVVRRALDAALLAPNSSNMQTWEFYWVRTPKTKAALVQACFGQSAAASAAELIVVASRVDTWRRNRRLVLAGIAASGPAPDSLRKYYTLGVPLAYLQGPFSLFGRLKAVGIAAVGLFRPVPRGPVSRAALFEVVTKSAALAAENLMLALAAQGYGSCPMEGFDAVRVKRLLGLGRGAHVVMAIGLGRPDPAVELPPQLRLAPELCVFQV